MKIRFKVLGRKYIDYKTDVMASNGIEAFQLALNLPTSEWQPTGAEDSIEPIDVIEDEEFEFDPINIIGEE